MNGFIVLDPVGIPQTPENFSIVRHRFTNFPRQTPTIGCCWLLALRVHFRKVR